MPEEEYWSSFFNADCVLTKLDCGEHQGDIVEFGCGYGLFTIAAAKRTSGSVYALDIEQEMLEATRQKASAAGLPNIVVEQRDFLADGSGRPSGSASYAMLFNILHVEKPGDLLRDAYRTLKPGGKAGIIHWNHDPSTPRGPTMDIRPRPEQCRQWSEEAGFQFLKFESLECCPYHYGIVVQRPARQGL